MRRKTNEEFVAEVFALVGNEYTLLEEYALSSVPMGIKHNKCGHSYKARPNAFLKGGRCPNCYGNKAKQKTTEQFKKEVYELVGDDYTILGEYINRSTKIGIRHNSCGREYEVEPGNFLFRSRCIVCYHNTLRLTAQEAASKVRSALGDGYRIVSEYVSLQHKTSLKHLDCGNVFKVRLTDVIQKKSSCPHCSQSSGEAYVASYLKAKGIPYEYHKKFDDLRDKAQLSYDFYLPDYNMFIEYQGTQHFFAKTFGGISKEKAEQNLILQQYHDKLKKEYAEANGYLLLTPTYKLDTYEMVIEYLDEKLHC